MLVTLLKSKLHCARVTECSRDYEGSLSIDRDLMDAVKIAPFEKLLIANVENGNRFETYAISAPRGSGKIGLNGAAALLGEIGDRLIILSFASIDADEISGHHPMILVLDANNAPSGGLKDCTPELSM